MRFPSQMFRPSAVFSIESQTGKTPRRTGTSMWKFFPALLVLFAAVATQAQQYTKIVVFGDSLSDTGNDAVLSYLQFGVPIPGPAADYTLGRFTDGPDTLPPAQNYFGVWVEQMAAALPAHPMVVASLQGGTNYAYGFAKTGSGTTLLTFGPDDEFIEVENVGQQIDDYLATNPSIDNHTLFVVWAGANDVLEAGSAGDVVNGALDEVEDIQRLIHAGATQFLVPNLPPLGLTPRFNTSSASAATANEASVLFNTTLDAGVSILPLLNFGKHLTINRLNAFTLLKQIVASPASYGLLNANSSSQLMLVDPDLYLFWDDLHPTTRGHDIVAMDALKLIEPAGCLMQLGPDQYVGRSAPGCR
ncbi:MAG TPA: SGNH/GDSL hydrolase family protein [Candidatus Aquilonibacter sp.]|nr:SGNH/GDSL hydrolase family protein [Candidatus Aquilonibacter sp.]